MINAKILKDSKAENGTRLTTFELEFPKFILAEFNTHRMLSRNAASSRAIPVNKILKMVWNDPVVPVHWGANNPGMQSKSELKGFSLSLAKFSWKFASKMACIFAWTLTKLGGHKQWVNRIIEPWTYVKVVASATDWDNFFHLRNHPDAQPEFHELARRMWWEYSTSFPQLLKEGEWHLPYIEEFDDPSGMGNIAYGIFENNGNGPEKYLTLEEAKKLSASLCAQVSYRLLDDSVEKALKIFDRLVTSVPVHSSPFEHQATPFKYNITESGNFRGWKQFREEIPGNVCKDYQPNIENKFVSCSG